MNSTEKQIETINNVINSTKENLKPISVNFIFWGLLITLMSLFHYAFPSLIHSSQLLYWTVLPLIGMILTVYYNIKIRKKAGYETYLSRVIKIIWGVFNLSWIYIIVLSFTLKSFHPVPPILFLLSIILIITGLIIKFKPVTIGGIFLTIFTFYLNFNPEFNLLLVNVVGVSLGMLVPGLSLFYSKSSSNPDG
jgi:predicted neutral ceramidase superfamily lipid hydrolase